MEDLKMKYIEPDDYFPPEIWEELEEKNKAREKEAKKKKDKEKKSK